MTPKVLKAYKKQGYRVDMGYPERLYSVLIDENKKRTISCSGGFTVSDAFAFEMIAKCIDCKKIYIIGNSFGLSTFFIADVFPQASIDVIDAEAEGLDVQEGSNVTRRIASEDFPNVQLTIGYSPQDVAKAMRFEKYNLIFIDGYHSHEQVMLDYNIMLPYAESDCVIYFHDIMSCNLKSSWDKIKADAISKGYAAYDLGYTQMGCGVLVKGYQDLQDYLNLSHNEFTGPYKIGFKVEDLEVPVKRPWFWDLSLGHIERLAKRKIKRIIK